MEDDPMMCFKSTMGDQWNNHVLPQTSAEAQGKLEREEK